jgi:hypothetical protein
MTKYSEKFPIVLTARRENVPKNYTILTLLKTGEVIAVSKYAEEFVVPDSVNETEDQQAA